MQRMQCGDVRERKRVVGMLAVRGWLRESVGRGSAMHSVQCGDVREREWGCGDVRAVWCRKVHEWDWAIQLCGV